MSIARILKIHKGTKLVLHPILLMDLVEVPYKIHLLQAGDLCWHVGFLELIAPLQQEGNTLFVLLCFLSDHVLRHAGPDLSIK